jgi:hypothetical protein
MNKPGNMPVDKWSEHLFSAGAIVVCCEMIALAAGSYSVVALAIVGMTLIVFSAMCRIKHYRRVRRYLQAVCLFALVVCLGCDHKDPVQKPDGLHSICVVPEAVELRIAKIESTVDELAKVEHRQYDVNESLQKQLAELKKHQCHCH